MQSRFLGYYAEAWRMELDNLLDKLKMDTLGAQLDAVCKQAAKKDLDYRGFPTAALKTEWQSRRVRGTEARLRKASAEQRLDKQLTYPKVLILDELGYLPMSRAEASLFFRLVIRRYERVSLILASNKGFADWGKVLGDTVMATAILDRLLHHATTIIIKGESYRFKEKRKAGLRGKTKPPTRSISKEEVPT